MTGNIRCKECEEKQETKRGLKREIKNFLWCLQIKVKKTGRKIKDCEGEEKGKTEQNLRRNDM